MKSLLHKHLRNQKNDSIYAGLQIRLLSTLIDCIIIGILLIPFFSISANFIYGNLLPGEVISSVLKEAEQLAKESNSFDASIFIKNNPQLYNYFVVNHGIAKMILDQLIQFFIFSIIILYCWLKQQASPGKRIFSLKIVDATTLQKPTKKQLVIRIFSYLLSILPLFLGIIWIAFDPKRQGWHDKIAKTLVIKDKSTNA